MVRRRLRFRRIRENAAFVKARPVPRRREEVVQPNVRIPGRKGVTGLARVQRRPRVYVVLIEHVLDGVTRDISATQPDHRANPLRHSFDSQHFAGCERVEITRDDVEAVLMLLNSLEQGCDLVLALSFTPVRKPGTQMQSEQTHLRFGDRNLQKRVLRVARQMPVVFGHRQPAQKACGVVYTRIPMLHASELGELRDHQSIGGFLK